MLKLIKRVYMVFKAYAVSDLLRSKGFVFGLVSMSIWFMLFISPIILFIDSSFNPRVASAYSFTAILIFLFYSVATWDWAAEIRWMINDGRLEYYIASGSGFLCHYLGIMPISFIWIAMAMSINYLLLTVVWGPPELQISDLRLFIYGFILLTTNLVSYALVLGGTMLSSGVTGFVMEIIGFITPIATGGLTPLINLPKPIQTFALMTPFSYPAEIIRYILLKSPTIMSIHELCIRGTLYSLTFLAVSIIYFRYQLKKIMREGVRVTTLW
ncbi:MAG: ABC transporter permease [Ignisphaera sp.]|uniref:ABC transporter permease n=1 Tax=Ignisphaera aggregans TaxID=334771 RepID=A0A7J3MXU0_9CREN